MSRIIATYKTKDLMHFYHSSEDLSLRECFKQREQFLKLFPGCPFYMDHIYALCFYTQAFKIRFSRTQIIERVHDKKKMISIGKWFNNYTIRYHYVVRGYETPQLKINNILFDRAEYFLEKWPYTFEGTVRKDVLTKRFFDNAEFYLACENDLKRELAIEIIKLKDKINEKNRQDSKEIS